MKNNFGEERRTRPQAGPSPAAAGGPPLSSSRAALLETLRAQAEPTTLSALARVAGLHENTVREHLEGLVAQGLATRHAAPPSGRGRPAWLYEATDVDPHASEYAGLATALAEAIHHRSPAPVEDAVAAGQRWGRELARERGVPTGQTATAARRAVVGLLDDMGFAPVTQERATTVRLTRCPLLQAAHKYPDVVCGVHLGLTQGALEESGADPAGVRLLPFAEPGACRLHLAARRQ